MTQNKKSTSAAPILWFEVFALLASYRQEMPVTELIIFSSSRREETGYYRCPRCRLTIEREFMLYCDRCGQHLGWRDYRKAKKTYWNNGGVP